MEERQRENLRKKLGTFLEKYGISRDELALGTVKCIELLQGAAMLSPSAWLQVLQSDADALKPKVQSLFGLDVGPEPSLKKVNLACVVELLILSYVVMRKVPPALRVFREHRADISPYVSAALIAYSVRHLVRMLTKPASNSLEDRVHNTIYTLIVVVKALL